MYEDKYVCSICKYSHILVELSSQLSDHLKRVIFFASEKLIFKKYQIIFSDSKNITLLRFSDNLEEGSINICKYLQMLQKYLSSYVVGGSVSWKGRSCGMVRFENYFLGFKKYCPFEMFR